MPLFTDWPDHPAVKKTLAVGADHDDKELAGAVSAERQTTAIRGSGRGGRAAVSSPLPEQAF